ncbi:MAG: LON peptidase substrate-binding domain-containing protein [Planctomycetota bacterium]
MPRRDGESATLHCGPRPVPALSSDPDPKASPVPTGWPPDGESSSQVAPVFPLAGVFLFPGQLLPLHIFEPRYRQMIEDSLDGTGRLILAAPCEDRTPLPQGPCLPAVCGLGEIVKHHRLPDGRFLIWVLGVVRVRATEVESDRLYRRMRYDVVEEVGPTRAEVDELSGPLQIAIRARVGDAMPDTANVATGQLADILAQCIQLPSALMAHIFAETHVTRRARMVLDAHDKFPSRGRAPEP